MNGENTSAAVEITYKSIRELFAKKRRRDAHKGDFGHVLVIAGSKGMAGAAILCARGALRTGAGLVSVLAPEEVIPIVQGAVPEAMCLTAPLSKSLLSSYGSIAIGPGLGMEEEAQWIVSYVLKSYKGKLVIDADALNIIAKTRQEASPSASVVITPHPGEAARLLGLSVSEIQADREAAAVVLAENLNCVAVLKGAGTIVAAKNTAQGLYINTTGNPGMATGGSGDVLAGVVASLAAQGMDALTAARAGAYIHGYAGDLAAADYGEAGLISGDLPVFLAKALKLVTE